MSKKIDHTGNKYGHLEMLMPLPPTNPHKTLWLAKCDCGNQVEICARQARAGRIKTCGKCEHHRRLTSSRNASKSHKEWVRILFSRYLRESVRRQVPWDLTPDQFTKIIKNSCTLCGEMPANRVQGSRQRYTPILLVERARGYTEENSIPCCLQCRQVVGQLNLARFLDIVTKISTHLRLTAG